MGLKLVGLLPRNKDKRHKDGFLSGASRLQTADANVPHEEKVVLKFSTKRQESRRRSSAQPHGVIVPFPSLSRFISRVKFISILSDCVAVRAVIAVIAVHHNIKPTETWIRT